MKRLGIEVLKLDKEEVSIVAHRDLFLGKHEQPHGEQN